MHFVINGLTHSVHMNAFLSIGGGMAVILFFLDKRLNVKRHCSFHCKPFQWSKIESGFVFYLLTTALYVAVVNSALGFRKDLSGTQALRIIVDVHNEYHLRLRQSHGTAIHSEEMKMPVITTETVSLLAPHVIELVRGVFRSRKDKELKGASEEQALDILNKDVLELQEVATKQAEAIAEIAQRVEARFGALEKQLKQQRLISLAALIAAAVALGVALIK